MLFLHFGRCALQRGGDARWPQGAYLWHAFFSLTNPAQQRKCRAMDRSTRFGVPLLDANGLHHHWR